MSQEMVGFVIDRLLNNEDLRVRFARDRLETLADLTLVGFELTPEEIDLFMQTDPRIWFWSRGVVFDQMH